MRYLKVANYASVIFFNVVIVTSLIVAYFILAPGDVLKNWKLSIPSGTYSVGQEVIVHVEVDKVKNIQAHAHRNIECQNKSGSFVSYHLADIASSNTSVGHISSNIPFKIPTTIPDLPTTCRFSIAATYRLNSLRQTTEYTASNNFKVKE